MGVGAPRSTLCHFPRERRFQEVPGQCHFRSGDHLLLPKPSFGRKERQGGEIGPRSSFILSFFQKKSLKCDCALGNTSVNPDVGQINWKTGCVVMAARIKVNSPLKTGTSYIKLESFPETPWPERALHVLAGFWKNHSSPKPAGQSPRSISFRGEPGALQRAGGHPCPSEWGWAPWEPARLPGVCSPSGSALCCQKPLCAGAAPVPRTDMNQSPQQRAVGRPLARRPSPRRRAARSPPGQHPHAAPGLTLAIVHNQY